MSPRHLWKTFGGRQAFHGCISTTAPVASVVLVFEFLVVGFQVFNMFISSVYYYLIPDVVPE